MSTQETEIQQELSRIVLPRAEWSASHALTVVTNDFANAEAYRTQNHDWRWEQADRRYAGVVPKKTWEGTNTPRSNVSVMTTYEQIEALLPVILQQIFGDEPWFEAQKMGKTTAKAAMVSRDVIDAQLWQCRVRKVIRASVRSALKYGNGPLESYWYYCAKKKKSFKIVYNPKTRTMSDPITQTSYQVPSGYKRDVVEEMIDDIENRPILCNIPITQFYIDQNCPSTDPEDAQFTITRKLESIGDLIEYRGDKQYDIPTDDEELIQWAREKPSTMGDMTEQNRAATHSWNVQPSIDQSVDPYALRVEVLRYKTKYRIVWVVNRKHVIYNVPNPYERKMQYSPFYTDLVDSFYGMSIADVVNGEQLTQEGLLNGRLDEIALGLHPHTKAKQNRQSPTYQLRVRPGGVSYHDDPKNDMIREYPTNITSEVPAELAASDMRVQKKTGLTDMALIGMSAGPNPGARSATGAGIQGRATQNRIQGQVENIAEDVLAPIFQDFHLLNNFHLDPDQKIMAVSGEEIDPVDVFGAQVRFFSRAAERMQSRIGLLQLAPFLIQYGMNPAFVQELAAQQKTLDFEEIFRLIIDSVGARKRADWIRPMTPQEIQAMQQQKVDPNKMIDMQMQDQRMEAMSDMADNKGTQDIVKQIVKNKGDVNKVIVDKALNGDKGSNGNGSSS